MRKDINKTNEKKNKYTRNTNKDLINKEDENNTYQFQYKKIII